MAKAIENVLDKRERQIIEKRYGLKGGGELPQREVAKQLGISSSYVSRIEKTALEKIEAYMRCRGIDEEQFVGYMPLPISHGRDIVEKICFNQIIES